MINNTSVQKWDRLAQKQLDQQFMNDIFNLTCHLAISLVGQQDFSGRGRSLLIMWV